MLVGLHEKLEKIKNIDVVVDPKSTSKIQTFNFNANPDPTPRYLNLQASIASGHGHLLLHFESLKILIFTLMQIRIRSKLPRNNADSCGTFGVHPISRSVVYRTRYWFCSNLKLAMCTYMCSSEKFCWRQE